MVEQSVLDGVYYILLLAGVMLLLILLVNNFVIFRRKLKDDISLMLIACFVTNVFELFWEMSENIFKNSALTYTFAILYVIFFLIFASIFNHFFLKNFNYLPKKKWALGLLYILPNLAYFVLSVTTPWTGLIFSMGENGVLIEGFMFEIVFTIIVFAYIDSSIILAIISAIKNRSHGSKTQNKITFLLIAFGIIIPLFWIIQILILGYESNYVGVSISLSIALVFLISNLDSLLLVDTETKIKAIETDLKIAANIQESALPPSNPHFDDKFHVAIRASMDTAKEVGGDFYDYFPIDDKRICFLAADVSGKGTPAALFMMTAKTVIKDHALIYDDTSKIFQLSNNRLQEGNKATMFATSWIAIFNIETMTLQYTNAGHTYPIFYRRGSGADYVKNVDGLCLGIMKNIPYKSNTVKVEKGDRIFLYTDGVTEAHNSNGKLYGEDRLLKIFTENIDKTEEEILDIIMKDINDFSTGVPQFDDITMMILTIK